MSDVDANEDLYSSLQNATDVFLEDDSIDSRFEENQMGQMDQEQKKTFRRISQLPNLPSKDAVQLTMMSKKERQREILKLKAQIKYGFILAKFF